MGSVQWEGGETGRRFPSPLFLRPGLINVRGGAKRDGGEKGGRDVAWQASGGLPGKTGQKSLFYPFCFLLLRPRPTFSFSSSSDSAAVTDLPMNLRIIRHLFRNNTCLMNAAPSAAAVRRRRRRRRRLALPQPCSDSFRGRGERDEDRAKRKRGGNGKEIKKKGGKGKEIKTLFLLPPFCGDSVSPRPSENSPGNAVCIATGAGTF